MRLKGRNIFGCFEWATLSCYSECLSGKRTESPGALRSTPAKCAALWKLNMKALKPLKPLEAKCTASQGFLFKALIQSSTWEMKTTFCRTDGWKPVATSVICHTYCDSDMHAWRRALNILPWLGVKCVWEQPESPSILKGPNCLVFPLRLLSTQNQRQHWCKNFPSWLIWIYITQTEKKRKDEQLWFQCINRATVKQRQVLLGLLPGSNPTN